MFHLPKIYRQNSLEIGQKANLLGPAQNIWLKTLWTHRSTNPQGRDYCGSVKNMRCNEHPTKYISRFFLYLIPNYNWRGHLSVDQNSSKLTFKTSESEISSPNLGLSADLDRWDYYFFSSKRSLCLGPKNEMMLLSWHFWCACCPSRFYLARLSFAWFKDAGNLRLIWPTVCVWNNIMSLCELFFSNLLSAYRLSSLYHKEKTMSNIQNMNTYMELHFLPLFENHEAFPLVVTTNAGMVCCFQTFAQSNLGEVLPENGTFWYHWWYFLWHIMLIQGGL